MQATITNIPNVIYRDTVADIAAVDSMIRDLVCRRSDDGKWLCIRVDWHTVDDAVYVECEFQHGGWSGMYGTVNAAVELLVSRGMTQRDGNNGNRN